MEHRKLRRCVRAACCRTGITWGRRPRRAHGHKSVRAHPSGEALAHYAGVGAPPRRDYQARMLVLSRKRGLATLHVLIIPSWYPTAAAAVARTFIRETGAGAPSGGGAGGRDLSGYARPARCAAWWVEGQPVPDNEQQRGRDPDPALPRMGSAQAAPLGQPALVARAVALTERYVSEKGQPQIVLCLWPHPRLAPTLRRPGTRSCQPDSRSQSVLCG